MAHQQGLLVGSNKRCKPEVHLPASLLHMVAARYGHWAKCSAEGLMNMHKMRTQ